MDICLRRRGDTAVGMTDTLPTEDDILRHQSLSMNFDDLLSDVDPIDASSSLIRGPGSIWSNNGGSSGSGEFISYTDYTFAASTNGQWGSYATGDGSPIKDVGFGQPDSDTGSDHSWYGSNGIDFNKASADGMQHYSEAFSSWSNAGDARVDELPAYGPFSTISVIDSFDGIQSGRAQSREKSPLTRSQSACATSRPTFADVAKKPSSPGSEPPPTPGLSNDGAVYASHESLNSLNEKSKPKVFRPAHPRHGGHHIPLPIKPDSKYGLDSFDVADAGGVKLERSVSCNDALETPSKDSDGAGAERKGASEPSKPWFDPKRMFQNGLASRGRSESVPCDTILNNNMDARYVTQREPNVFYEFKFCYGNIFCMIVDCGRLYRSCFVLGPRRPSLMVNGPTRLTLTICWTETLVRLNKPTPSEPSLVSL